MTYYDQQGRRVVSHPSTWPQEVEQLRAEVEQLRAALREIAGLQIICASDMAVKALRQSRTALQKQEGE